MEPVLYTQYKKTVAPAMMQRFGFTNPMQVPKVMKVTVNVGYGRHVKDKAYIENVERTLTLITGQKPVHNKAKKSISNFKIRAGMPIGISAALRGARMYEFLYKMIHLTFPRTRDFRGIRPNGFDAQGNYTVGLKENIAFPEITAEGSEKIHGLEIVITTSAKNKEQGFALLKEMGFPFTEK